MSIETVLAKYQRSILIFFSGIIFCIYSPMLSIGFAKVDDQWMLLGESLVSSPVFDLSVLKNIFLHVNSLQYSPLNTLYYYAIYQINGFDPYYYHIVSLLLHIVNFTLIYTISKILLTRFKLPNVVTISLFSVTIWAVLPFNVESVVWISASKTLLYTFLGNISFLCFIQSYFRSSKALYLLSIIFFILSFLAKEQAVLYAFMMLIFVYTYQMRHLKKNTNLLLRFSFPFLVLALTLGLVTTYIGIYGDGIHEVDRYPFNQRFILSFYCIFFYFTNCFAPSHLHYHYPFPMRLGESLPTIYYVIAIMLCVMSYYVYKILKQSKNKAFYLFCFGVFFSHLLLTIQIVPLARAAMLADRYMYIPSWGLLMGAFTALSERSNYFINLRKNKEIIVIGSFMIYLLLLCTYSCMLVTNWKGMEL